MKEKKLTDEEIIKAFEHCNKSLPHDKCLFAEQHRKDWVTCQSKCGRMIIDLIHRLQGENKGKTEHLEKCLDEIDRLKTAHAEQKAEIERLKQRHGVALLRNDDLDLENYELKKQVDELKSENTELYKEHTTLIAGSILDKQKQKAEIERLTEELDLANETIDRNNKRYERVSIERQKALDRVDFLEDALLDKIRRNEELITAIKQAEQQAVKNTAKEIIRWIKLNGILEYGGYVIHDSTIEQMCKKFGVEVE